MLQTKEELIISCKSILLPFTIYTDLLLIPFQQYLVVFAETVILKLKLVLKKKNKKNNCRPSGRKLIEISSEQKRFQVDGLCSFQ